MSKLTYKGLIAAVTELQEKVAQLSGEPVKAAAPAKAEVNPLADVVEKQGAEITALTKQVENLTSQVKSMTTPAPDTTKAEAKTEAKTEAKAEAKTEAKTEAKAEDKTEAKAEDKSKKSDNKSK